MIRESNCSKRNCKHYLGIRQKDGLEVNEVHHCSAFLEGIPKEIAFGKDLHVTLKDNQDNNVTYEPER